MSSTKLARIRRVAIGGTAAAAMAVPLAMVSAPAQAATMGGCTVVPLNPVRVGTTITGVPLVRFSTRVSCLKDRIVQIQDQRLESDAPAGVAGDDSYGLSTYLRTFAANGTVVVSTVDQVTNTEAGPEEVYHRTRFRVATINGVTGFTGFQNSGPLAVIV